MSENNLVKTGKFHMTKDKRQSLIILIVFAALIAFFGILSPYFLKPDNLFTILTASVPLGLIAISESVCLLTGQFDMSVGMVASLAGVIWTKLIAECGMPVYAAFALGLLAGILSGYLVGASVAYLKMPAWMVTYAVLQIIQGVIYIITNGDAIRMTKFKAFKFLGQHKIFGVPITPALIILLLALLIVSTLLRKTRLGRNLFIIGGNLEAARNMGIHIRACQVFVFTLSGVLSAMAGLLFASRSGSGQPIIGESYAMQAIAGSVVGGTSMAGGKTNLAMSYVGVLIIVTLQNGLNMIAMPTFYQHIVTGAILILAILVQTQRNK